VPSRAAGEGVPIKPNIIAIAAVTIDGKIARHPGQFTDWTSPEDKTFLRSMLDQSDAVVVGNNTYKTAEGPLSKRNCIVFTRSVQDTERRGSNLLYYNGDGKSSIEAILEPHRLVSVLGGMQIYSYFLERDLIDEVYLTIEPIVFGQGLDLFHCKDQATRKFRLVAVRELNRQGSVLLHYRRPSAETQLA
jgi:dihydrofolate reductase